MSKFAEKIPEHIKRLEADNKRLRSESTSTRIQNLEREIEEKETELEELQDDLDDAISENKSDPAEIERQKTITENERIIKQLKLQQGAVK